MSASSSPGELLQALRLLLHHQSPVSVSRVGTTCSPCAAWGMRWRPTPRPAIPPPDPWGAVPRNPHGFVVIFPGLPRPETRTLLSPPRWRWTGAGKQGTSSLSWDSRVTIKNDPVIHYLGRRPQFPILRELQPVHALTIDKLSNLTRRQS